MPCAAMAHSPKFNSAAEHAKHIDMVMKALMDPKLHMNPGKCMFFLLEVDFLGHHISARRIEPNSSKVDKILNWPVPQNSTDVHTFLGLAQYIAQFLLKLAEHTVILTPLTTKDTHTSISPCGHLNISLPLRPSRH